MNLPRPSHRNNTSLRMSNPKKISTTAALASLGFIGLLATAVVRHRRHAAVKEPVAPVEAKDDSGPIARKISGTVVAAKVNAERKQEIDAIMATDKKQVTLAVILVGERKDSQSYVRNKTKCCKEVGIESSQHNLPGDVSEAKLMELVAQLNKDDSINGILVQLPLPKHINADRVIQSIDPVKDVDGLHEMNIGQVGRLGMNASLISCTPLGCMELLKHEGVQIEGKHAVVVGRSNLVGKPVAQLLLSRNATVTMAHSRTADLPAIVRQADILVVAIGKANFVRGDWIKPGAVVIDVGMNAVEDKSLKSGHRLVGDVHYAEAVKVASAVTPVPGGVGPMTVAMLLRNTVVAYRLQKARKAASASQ